MLGTPYFGHFSFGAQEERFWKGFGSVVILFYLILLSVACKKCLYITKELLRNLTAWTFKWYLDASHSQISCLHHTWATCCDPDHQSKCLEAATTAWTLFNGVIDSQISRHHL